MKNNYWDLSNRPHTKLKLEIYKKYLAVWCKIFKNQYWAKEIYIVDCFAGKGIYDNLGDFVDGSPLIAIKIAESVENEFNNAKNKNKDYFKIKCFFIENDENNVKNLKKLLEPHKNKVSFEIIYGDFNKSIESVLRKIGNKPTLFFIDPYGIKEVKKESVLTVINKDGAKDILLNYINEGVVRIAGLARKCMDKKADDITIKEIKTITNLTDFIGEECLDFIDKNHLEFLKYYVDNVLKANNGNVDSKNKLEVVAFDMPYPNKSDTIYYLLFASRNKTAVKIVKQVYAKSKTSNLKGQKSLFDMKEQMRLHGDFEIR